ncbi:MAG: PAS domain-containing protein, partial [Ginsengibacter sp.]
MLNDSVGSPDMVTFPGDPIISKDLNGIITSWNDAATSVFGFTSHEAVGKHISIIIPAALINEENSYDEQIKGGLGVKHYQTIRQRKDRSNFAASVTISPIKNAEANVIAISILSMDVSERKSNEYHTSLLASIINCSDDAIISKNVNGIITSWNEGAEHLFGYTAAEAIDQHISLIIPVYKLDEEATIISKILNGEKIDHIDTVRKCK